MLRSCLCVLSCILSAIAVLFTSNAQAISTIRDAESESLLEDMARPLLLAAGLTPENVELVIVNDQSINAFVAGGANIFIHTGLITEARTSLELMGVLAHESAHIAAGHLGRHQDQIKRASAKGLAAVVLGLGAAVVSKNNDVAVAATQKGREIAYNDILSFSRAQESQADQLAVTYLDSAGISSKGLSSFLATLQQRDYLMGGDSYWRTHPMSRDRVRMLEANINRSRNKERTPSFALEQRFARVKAKIFAYLESENAVRQAYPLSDTSLAARYARAVSAYRNKGIDAALDHILPLISAYPQDPYFHELLAQTVFEHGLVEDALLSYQQAISLAPQSAILRASYAHALMASGNTVQTQEAAIQLDRALVSEPRNASFWHSLAKAQGTLGQQTLAQLSLAEASLASRDFENAKIYAKRVQDLSQEQSPQWRRAMDIQRLAQKN